MNGRKYWSMYLLASWVSGCFTESGPQIKEQYSDSQSEKTLDGEW